MNSKEKAFIESLIKINHDKQQPTLFAEFQQMYRVSIQMKKRREFIEKIRANALVMDEMNMEKIFLELGQRMFAFTNIYAEYVEFVQWLEKMTGQTFSNKQE